MSTDLISVLIVGGGLSGTLTAIHLLRSTRGQSTGVTLLNPTPEFGRGLAYRSNDDNLLLNVPAGNMSAFADAPSHFVDFCRHIDPSINTGSFVSRRLYGRYLEQCLQEAVAEHPGRLQVLVDEAHEIHALPVNGRFTVRLASGQCLKTKQVILALGHQLPRFPLSLSPAQRPSVIEAWDFDSMNRLPADSPVLILGTGHTAVDALFHLTQQAQPRTVWMVSRHGLLPHPHRPNPNPPPGSQYPAYVGKGQLHVRSLMRQLRQEVERQISMGSDWRDVLNQLRPHTPRLWQALASGEQRRFLRHVVPFWDIHRHRLAPLAADRLQSLLMTGHVHVIAARLLAIRNAKTNGLEIEFRPRHQQISETLNAAAIINCTGPSMAIDQDSHPLLQHLAKNKLLTPAPCGLGLMVNDKYQLTDIQGHAIQGLWYVGPMLKARDWEAIAAPELRVHTQKLAQELARELATCSIHSIQANSV
ncbi:FAD/NAD(P)-binding protein [Pseudomonas protegens]|uniref:FAD/NAD(P)-binding protein n=1 Tax=Pseudomonas protegens TaxID=380021 RepID=UPI0024C3F4C2|nr:FAD/NAD(P)-binding protein [Pseudomonas protegens]MDK1400043.1 FAD/NAD(P)-binding protein [Pseudomonas protegens]